MKNKIKDILRIGFYDADEAKISMVADKILEALNLADEKKYPYRFEFVAEESDCTIVEMTKAEAKIVTSVLQTANSNVDGYCGSVYVFPDFEEEKRKYKPEYVTESGWKFKVLKKINPGWCEYDCSVAKTHLAQWDVIFADYDCETPIDNEYDLEVIAEMLNL